MVLVFEEWLVLLLGVLRVPYVFRWNVVFILQMRNKFSIKLVAKLWIKSQRSIVHSFNRSHSRIFAFMSCVWHWNMNTRIWHIEVWFRSLPDRLQETWSKILRLCHITKFIRLNIKLIALLKILKTGILRESGSQERGLILLVKSWNTWVLLKLERHVVF